MPTTTVTLAAILKLAPALQALSSQPLGGRTAFRVGRLFRAVTEALEQYDTARRALVREHAQTDEAGEAVTLEKGGQSLVALRDSRAFEQAHALLLEETVELPAFELPLSWVTTSATGEPLAIPASVLAPLMEWIIEDDEDAGKAQD